MASSATEVLSLQSLATRAVVNSQLNNIIMSTVMSHTEAYDDSSMLMNNTENCDDSSMLVHDTETCDASAVPKPKRKSLEQKALSTGGLYSEVASPPNDLVGYTMSEPYISINHNSEQCVRHNFIDQIPSSDENEEEEISSELEVAEFSYNDVARSDDVNDSYFVNDSYLARGDDVTDSHYTGTTDVIGGCYTHMSDVIGDYYTAINDVINNCCLDIDSEIDPNLLPGFRNESVVHHDQDIEPSLAEEEKALFELCNGDTHKEVERNRKGKAKADSKDEADITLYEGASHNLKFTNPTKLTIESDLPFAVHIEIFGQHPANSSQYSYQYQPISADQRQQVNYCKMKKGNLDVSYNNSFPKTVDNNYILSYSEKNGEKKKGGKSKAPRRCAVQSEKLPVTLKLAAPAPGSVRYKVATPSDLARSLDSDDDFEIIVDNIPAQNQNVDCNNNCAMNEAYQDRREVWSSASFNEHGIEANSGISAANGTYNQDLNQGTPVSQHCGSQVTADKWVIPPHLLPTSSPTYPLPYLTSADFSPTGMLSAPPALQLGPATPPQLPPYLYHRGFNFWPPPPPHVIRRAIIGRQRFRIPPPPMPPHMMFSRHPHPRFMHGRYH